MKHKNTALIFEELASMQKKKMLECGRNFIANLTEDDMAQPFDYKELEENPHFRYEEGILAGIQMCKAALLAEDQTIFFE